MTAPIIDYAPGATKMSPVAHLRAYLAFRDANRKLARRHQMVPEWAAIDNANAERWQRAALRLGAWALATL